MSRKITFFILSGRELVYTGDPFQMIRVIEFYMMMQRKIQLLLIILYVTLQIFDK